MPDALIDKSSIGKDEPTIQPPSHKGTKEGYGYGKKHGKRFTDITGMRFGIYRSNSNGKT
jgi:hypothetical protein